MSKSKKNQIAIDEEQAAVDREAKMLAVEEKLTAEDEIGHYPRIKSTPVPMSLAALATMQLSKEQGLLNLSRVEKYLNPSRLIAALTTPNNPPCIYRGTVPVANHRVKALQILLSRNESSIDPSMVVTVNVIDPTTDPQEVARVQVLDNIEHSNDKVSEQYIFNPNIDIAAKVMQPLFKILDKNLDGSNIKRSTKVRLTQSVGAYFHSHGDLPRDGATLYDARSLPEYSPKKGIFITSKRNLTTNSTATVDLILQFKEAVVLLGALMVKATKEAKRKGRKGVESAIGSNRTTFYYIMLTAAIDGRLTKENVDAVATKLISKGDDIHLKLESVACRTEDIEDDICSFLKIDKPVREESEETNKKKAA